MAPKKLTPAQTSAKKMANVVYLLQVLSFLTGITAIIGLIINYVKRSDAKGSWLESHYRWQIRTFWFALLWLVLGCLLVIILIGYLILLANTIWVIYRIIKGWIKLSEEAEVA